MRRLAAEARWMIVNVVLWNRTVEQWCHDHDRQMRAEVQRLLGALDLIAEHFNSEIDERRADIPAKAVA
jgi:hypothetical protein